MNNSVFKQITIVALFSILALGSASTPPPTYSTTNYQALDISGGVLANKDIKIVAEDGSFTLEGGKRFSTPFSIYDWNDQSDAFTAESKMLDNFPNALRSGAKRVYIYQDGVTQPLHGVLVFNQAIQAAFGPAARSYMVNIPVPKLQAARDGVTAVAWEYMEWKSSWSNGSSKDKKWYSWALWMSAYPL